MQTTYYVLLAFGLLTAILFTIIVLITGKGDAMSGGGGAVRTTFKGKASFDDHMSRLTLILGAAFFAFMIVIDAVSNRLNSQTTLLSKTPAANSAPAGNTPATNAPANTPKTK